MMAKKTQKQGVRSEKNNAGCMSGLISIFDFRHGRSTQKLLSDRRHGSARHAGISNSKGKLNTLTSSDDKPKSVHSVNDNDGTVDFSRSVKILMEEEMSRVKQPKKNPKADTAQNNHIEVSYENNHKKESEDSVLCDLHLNDRTTRISDKLNNLSKTERLYYNIHLAGLLEEICGDRHQCQRLLKELKKVIDSCPSQESADKVACDLLDQPETQLGEDHSTIHKVLIETAEALMSQDVKATLNTTPHPSGNLTNALDMNSKELLLELLQDRGSHLVKHIEEIKNGKKDKSSEPESCKLLQEQNVSSEQCEDPISHIMFQKQNLHRLFRKKDKLLQAKVSNGGDDGQTLNKIVVLKPAPPRGQNSSNAISLSPSPSFDNLRAETEKGKVASHFSFKEIKRRLKHAIGDNGKGHHILSMDGVLHRIPYETQQSGDSDGRLKDSGQAKSISRTSHHKEQASQLTPISKKKDKKLKPKESQSNIRHEGPVQDKNLCLTTTTSLHREHNFQREARKHLADMFNNVDTEANLPSIQSSKPLGRMLSLSEYSFLSPRLSPGREKESILSPRQMRLSSFWQLKQENGKHSSPLRESNVESPCTGSGRTLDQVCESDLNIQIQGNTTSGEISVLESLSNGEISSPKGCARLVEQLDNEHGRERDILNVPSELSVDGPADAVERSEEEQSSLSPRATSSETIETVTLSVPSTPTTLLVDDIGSPYLIIEKPDRPSPVSVLEPLFTEDASSPVNCTDVHVDIQAQPHSIHFDEDENSVVVLTTSYNESDQHRTCLGDKECRLEYVRAVIEASGLLQDLLSDRWHASPLLSPSLYDEVEYSSDEFPDDLRLLFDSINEVLEVLRDNFFSCTPWVSPAKSGVRPIPSREDFIKQVWKGVDQRFPFQAPQTLEQIVGNDMDVIPWMDLRSEIDNIGIDMGDAIIDDIMEETLVELWAWFPDPPLGLSTEIHRRGCSGAGAWSSEAEEEAGLVISLTWNGRIQPTIRTLPVGSWHSGAPAAFEAPVEEPMAGLWSEDDRRTVAGAGEEDSSGICLRQARVSVQKVGNRGSRCAGASLFELRRYPPSHGLVTLKRSPLRQPLAVEKKLLL
ncbi:hypothetical protein Taro_023335 [Colocasia esculenta]|uniref:DUF4378 domain-containing protein n=1 Tax=Colocasia esculenta TaxID=4460 RepID=A0A843UX30_COLES|nr:hypothetical protein [Colocasia esculenta]